MTTILDLDRALFMKINLDWTNRAFDWFFPRITDLHSNPYTLAVVLPLLAFWVYRQRGRAARWLLLGLVCIGLSDLISYRLVKATIERPRPEDSGIHVVLRTHQHHGTSFTSNHSANVFAGATVLAGALPGFAPVFFIVAALVAYSRIYVGVHFPLDVLGGALLGILIGRAAQRLAGAWLDRKSSGTTQK